MSSSVHLLLGGPEVEHYIGAHGLRGAQVALESIMLEELGPDGRPHVHFVLRLDDGSRVMASVAYRVLQTTMAGMTGALQRRTSEPAPSTCKNDRPLRAVYPCGCSHHKVELGQCHVYAPDGSVRT